MLSGFENKVVIITGAGSGIGEATAKKFADNGSNVVIADFNFEQAVRVHTEISKLGGKSIPLKVNVADRDSVDSMVKDVVSTFGTVHIVVCNAGITKDKTFAKMTQQQWDDVIAVNQTGVFNTAQACLPFMIEQGFGRILVTSSIVGVYSNIGQTNYSATKAAVIAMVKGWAKELGRKGITANAVAPGFIRTPMTASMPPEILDKMAKMVPLQRLGEAEDIANAFMFLASNEANYINGEVLNVNGALVI